jgi:outer membrane biosynthesis protein TonB
METLLIFFAIIAIQMLAAYFNQKKEAEKKAQRKNAAPPPQKKQHKEYEAISKPKPKPVPKQIPKPKPPQKDDSQIVITQQKLLAKPRQKLDYSQLNLKNPAQGIIWNAILREPRWRSKWRR